MSVPMRTCLRWRHTDRGPGIPGPGDQRSGRLPVTQGPWPHTLPMRPGFWTWGREPPLPRRICKQGQRDVLLEILEVHSWSGGFQMWLGRWRQHFRWVGTD